MVAPRPAKASRPGFLRRCAGLATVGFWSWLALGFANLPIGALVDNPSLPALGGGEQHLLSDTNVSVFIFFKPGLEHSNQALVQIAACQQAMTNEPVHWCAIVSDRSSRAEVEATVKATGLAMPVLIDGGDALYGKFGVVLHPVIGITDQNRRLVAYQPFAKVNYGTVMEAQIRHALNEITDQELAAVLQPQPVIYSGDISTAHRFLRLAGKQFAATNYDRALVNVGHSLDKNPTAAAWSLKGRILTAQGKPAEARAAFAAALKLDAQDPAALEGMKALEDSGK